MHELSLMEEVRRLALEEMERHGGGHLCGLTLRIGSLAPCRLPCPCSVC